MISIHVPRMGDDNRYIEKVTGRKDFNPRPRMGDDRTVVPTVSAFMISIHVPRMGDDSQPVIFNTLLRKISIHVPRTGDDRAFAPAHGRKQHFNPRPPHGGRLVGSEDSQRSEFISIHVPHTGDDHPYSAYERGRNISIHVPRAGDDSR